MLEDSFIETLGTPICPYCNNEMQVNHQKIWTGKNYKVLSLEFRCLGSAKYAHQVLIRARNLAEWNHHLEILKLTAKGKP